MTDVPKARVQNDDFGVFLDLRYKWVQVERTPATTELDVLLVVEIVLVAEKDDATLSDQGCQLF